MISEQTKNFLYPPGGILIWMLILIETFTFGIGIIVFLYQKSISPEVFESSQHTLNTNIGLINTILLLTSGFFVAEALRQLKLGNSEKSQNRLILSILFGAGFLILKWVEYYSKLEHGYDLSYNMFFLFYWLLTGFHFLHVLVGLVILSALLISIRKGRYHKGEYYDVESGTAFWHMCDLIWLLLFPILYLLI